MPTTLPTLLNSGQPMRGEVALALGARAAGVRVVTGYPGSPASGVLEHLLSISTGSEMDVQWSPNERVALEVAFGASLAGARALVVLKSVGLNVALDPLATMAMSGCYAGLVVLLGDDPGAGSSQNEQDSRWAARLAEVPLVEATHVESAASLMAQAFAWSESLGTPVILRITRPLAVAQAPVEEPWPLPPFHKPFLHKRGRWVVLPGNVLKRRRSVHRHLREFAQLLEPSPYDREFGEGPWGVVAAGFTQAPLRAVLAQASRPVQVLELASAWPLPEQRLVRWLRERQRVLVLEDGGPFVEESVRALAQRHGLTVPILGRLDRHVPEEGALTELEVGRALEALCGTTSVQGKSEPVPALPSEQPLCDACGYLPVFQALVAAMEENGGRRRHIIVAEPGCMVRADLPPLELLDVKYSLGSSLGLALGLAMARPRERIIALMGDSSFFHSTVSTLPYAAQRRLPLVAVLLDNGGAALTGGQPHPGCPRDAHGAACTAIDPVQVIRGCGIEPQVCDTEDPLLLQRVLQRALAGNDLQVIVVRCPCPRLETESTVTR
ncbi:MAG: thiamine pyrophosphate-dependent enzyme [Anaerolineae bacterium]